MSEQWLFICQLGTYVATITVLINKLPISGKKMQRSEASVVFMKERFLSTLYNCFNAKYWLDSQSPTVCTRTTIFSGNGFLRSNFRKN